MDNLTGLFCLIDDLRRAFESARKRAKQEGVPKAARDLGLAPTMLYGWQAKARQTGTPFEEQRLQQAEMAQLKRENARLAEEVAFLKKAAAYFAREPQ